jgi:hypothetical protein
MALQLYAIGEIYIGSKLLAQEGSLSVSRKTNSQAIMTVANGYSGESPGAPMCEVEVTSAVPAAGFELDPGDYMGAEPEASTVVAALRVVSFTIHAAGKLLQFKGFIIEDSFSHAVNSEAKLNFKARGEFALWQP